MRTPTFTRMIAALLGAAVALPGGQPAQADVVGAAGAVNTQSTGTPPGLPIRTIEIGEQVVHNEKISTAKSGTVQIVFIDKTTLNIGPNSTLVIDDFVYSPAEATGRMTLSLGKGVLRIVGGQATHTGGATINTAVATIGIRGGIATLDYCPASAGCGAAGLLVTNHFGQVTVSGASGATQTISRPGFSVAVGPSGEMSESPFRAAQSTVDATNKKLTSKGKQKGGSSVTPTDTLAVQQGLGQFNAALNPGLNVPRQGQTVPWGTKQNPALLTSNIAAETHTTIQTSIAQSAVLAAPRSNKDLAFVTQTPTPSPTPTPSVAVVQPPTPAPTPVAQPTPTPAIPSPTPTAASPAPTAPVPATPAIPPVVSNTPAPAPSGSGSGSGSGGGSGTGGTGGKGGSGEGGSGGGGGSTSVTILPSTAYALTATTTAATYPASMQGRARYLLGSVAGQGSFNVSTVLGYRAGGAVSDRFTNTASNVLGATLAVNGSGASQTSALTVMTGRIANDKAYGFTLSGGIEVTSLDTQAGSSRSGATPVSSPANTADASAGSVPVDAQFVPSGAFSVNQQRFVSDNANNIHSYVTSGSNDGAPTLNQTWRPTAASAGLGADHPDRHLQGYVGGLAQTTRLDSLSPSIAIVTNASGTPGDVNITLPGKASSMGATFNVVNSTPTTTSGFRGATFNFGALQSGADASRGTYVDTRNFAAISEQKITPRGDGYAITETSSIDANTGSTPASNLHLLMVTSDTVLGTSATTHTSSLFPGVNFCACDFTRWGFWSFRSGQQDTSSDGSTVGHLLTWVAGVPSGASDIPTTGTATYNGHIIASINNNGAQYSAASNFQNAVNFGTRTGLVSIPSLDGAAFQGTLSFHPQNPTQFGGMATGTLGRSMTLNGTFFQSATSSYGEMGGTAAITGSNYLGGGIFAAHAR